MLTKINIEMLPKGQPHRHGLPDEDDYWYDTDATLQIRITEQEDYRDFQLLAAHALIEAFANEHLGVTPSMVDAYDATVPADEQPGDRPGCPYFPSHQAAMAGEKAL